MSNYNKSTNFAVKDTLTSGDPEKVVSGVEIDNEFNSIASAVTSKADKVAAATADNIATLDANGNLKDSGGSIISVAPPVGSVTMYAASSAPDGWLECDGSNVNRATFPNLFNAIGITFGSGDGSTTFGLPDLRGEFVRGWDDGRGVDSGRGFGTAQLDQIQRITGRFAGGRADGGSFESGAFTEVLGTTANAGYGSGSGKGYVFDFDTANSPNARTSSTTDGETRPRNIALMYIIKT